MKINKKSNSKNLVKIKNMNNQKRKINKKIKVIIFLLVAQSFWSQKLQQIKDLYYSKYSEIKKSQSDPNKDDQEKETSLDNLFSNLTKKLTYENLS